MNLREEIYTLIRSLREDRDGYIDGADEAADEIMSLVAVYAEEVRSEAREQAAQDLRDEALDR